MVSIQNNTPIVLRNYQEPEKKPDPQRENISEWDEIYPKIMESRPGVKTRIDVN